MKRTILAAVFVLGVTITYAQTQTADKAYLLNVHALGADRSAVKATRDFWSRVGEQKEEQWYKLPAGGFMAEYLEGKTQARFMYNAHGDFIYSILTYDEKKLPADVRHLVRSNYYDYSITWVKEINEPEIVVYVVHIEDASSWKELAVQDGEIRVLQSFCKQ